MNHLKRATYFLKKAQTEQRYRKAFYKKIADLRSHFKEVVQYLSKDYGITPLLIGGLAVQHYGVERQTVDIDILLSKIDYQTLLEDRKIKYGTLKFKPGVQVDVLSEGKDGNPNPEIIRDGNSVYPTLEGLIYLKLIARRLKDQGDIAELLKANGLTQALKKRVLSLLPEKHKQPFLDIWNTATKEQKGACRIQR